MFITLEKAISTASKFQLFEFNDEFTRANFRNIVEPFLREVQGRRGITDFLVVCDETNNTGEVIDRNEFVAEIFVENKQEALTSLLYNLSQHELASLLTKLQVKVEEKKMANINDFKVLNLQAVAQDQISLR